MPQERGMWRDDGRRSTAARNERGADGGRNHARRSGMSGTATTTQPGGTAGASSARPNRNSGAGLLAGPLGRSLGLVVALVLLCIVGVVTAGDRFANIDNVLTILRLAAVIGVVSIGMTFVIIGGGGGPAGGAARAPPPG